jgi:uncharacterized membrane protein YbhN (UPF0104 family)
MDKSKLILAFKIAISVLLLGYLFVKVDLSAIAGALRRVDLSFYFFSTLVALVSNVFIAGKYYLLTRQTAIYHPLRTLVKINFISRFYALFLPSAVGREFVRWIKVTRNREGRVSFAASILFERLTFLMVLILCGSVPLYLNASMPQLVSLRMRLQPWIALAIIGISLMLTFFLSASVRSLSGAIAGRLLHRFADKFDLPAVVENFSLAGRKAAPYAIIVGLSVVWQIFFISRLFMLIKAAELPLSLIDIVWMGSLVLLLQTLPISLSGIGLREGAYAYLFTLYGLPPEKGVLLGILFFSQMLIMALIGGAFELLDP